MVASIGRATWAIPGGHIPSRSTGHEPEFVSCDRLCVLNTGERDANLEITLHYIDADPIGPYRLKVKARRARQVRLNDLIDPQAPPLDTDYGAVIRSDVPVVVQFGRLDSSRRELALLGTMAFAGSP